ncbi:uncharacterized protein LOC141638473 [Silene latifolia]|uniref:uncharacterized protein LOC141638473 n=1 Tax=Silene latifolia TaxID=37657 RepID=UPI003D771DE8
MFILPKGVLDRVDAICRNFLWEGSTEYSKAPRIAWTNVCVPKKEGGLGLKQSVVWNASLVGKLVWWIVAKQDTLWVQWIHHVYLKGQSFLSYSPHSDTSWYWKKICKVKEMLIDCFEDTVWKIWPEGFTVKSCYNWLRNKHEDVWWCKTIWSNLGAPKHAFVAWLITTNALMLKSKLFQLHIAPDNLCCICQLQEENHVHLFHHCVYSAQILQGVGQWLHSDLTQSDFLMKVTRSRWGRLRKSICCAAVFHCWYAVWLQRNQARIHHCIVLPAVVIAQVQQALRIRYCLYKSCIVSSKDRAWLIRVQLESH